MRYNILLYKGEVIATEIKCMADTPDPVKKGMAAIWAHRNKLSLSNTVLTGADLRNALWDERDLLVPKINDIHQSVYEAAKKPGALHMASWHSCETTHCRAGWVVTLAGPKGRDLEKKLGTGTAATLIYMASDPGLRKIPNWLASEETALADMKRLADEEKRKKNQQEK